MANISVALDEVAKKWNTSGQIALAKEGTLWHFNHYGYDDRENLRETSRESRYTLSLQMPLLLALASLRLIESKKLDLKDPISTYLPEVPYGDQIHIEDLLRRRSGLIDYFYGIRMLELNEDPHHQNLSDEKRTIVEQMYFNQERTFEKVLKLIEGHELVFVPGTVGYPPSETELIFLMEIICRITKQAPFEAMKTLVFDVFGMSGVLKGKASEGISYKVLKENILIRTPLDYEAPHLLTMGSEDLIALVCAISKGQGLKLKTWKLATKFDEENTGLLFEDANGFACSRVELLGSGLYLYFNIEMKVAFAALVNEEQTFENVDGDWQFFRKDLRQAVDAQLTYPVNTKMIKLNKENLWSALGISVAKDQLDFVLEAKSSIAMGLLYKTKKVFVQMEGTRSIGLLVLDVDHKKQHYSIDIIQIDQRFQGRGYGKHMLTFAVSYLKKAGAKELEIGVHRRNKAAQKLYMSVGFTAKKIYEEGMSLHMIL